MCLYPCKSQCAQIDGGQRTAQTLGLSMGKQHMLSHITAHFIFSLDFFCNHICTTTPYHTKVCHLVEWMICCEDFEVKSGVHAVENQTRAP